MRMILIAFPISGAFAERRQGTSVDDSVTGDRDCHVVATEFALDAHMTGDPPDRGMVKEDGLDGALQYMYQIVVWSGVGRIRNQIRFKLCGRQADGGPGRHH